MPAPEELFEDMWATPLESRAMRTMSYREALREAMLEEMRRDPNVVDLLRGRPVLDHADGRLRRRVRARPGARHAHIGGRFHRRGHRRRHDRYCGPSSTTRSPT